MLGGGDGDPSAETWWSRAAGQSDLGILLKVGGEEEIGSTGHEITELLLYAAVAEGAVTLPTPPASSSPAPDDRHPELLHEACKDVNVFALPLCSNILRRAKAAVDRISSVSDDSAHGKQAFFLQDPRRPAQTQMAPQKRQNISTLFDDATQKSRKFKGRGGESISQAMASIDRPPSQPGLPLKPESQAPSLDQQSLSARKRLSRAPSISSTAGLDYPRPVSRSGALANGKRSSLHRVESVISPRGSPTLFDVDSSCAQQNKAALTKIVMAGMRLYGLQQKKKANKSKGNTELPNLNIVDVADEPEDEYKLVYHQTYKAAIFAFRKHVNVKVITQEAMRDVVDQMLALFCTDPFKVNDSGGRELLTLDDNEQPSSSPFDKPSAKALASSAAKGWTTPLVKKH